VKFLVIKVASVNHYILLLIVKMQHMQRIVVQVSFTGHTKNKKLLRNELKTFLGHNVPLRRISSVLCYLNKVTETRY
jgi:hypothetical protein